MPTSITKNQLLEKFPFLDDLMAESILAAYEGGYLQKVLDEEENAERDFAIRGVVTIDDPEKKEDDMKEQECEEPSANSSS